MDGLMTALYYTGVKHGCTHIWLEVGSMRHGGGLRSANGSLGCCKGGTGNLMAKFRENSRRAGIRLASVLVYLIIIAASASDCSNGRHHHSHTYLYHPREHRDYGP